MLRTCRLCLLLFAALGSLLLGRFVAGPDVFAFCCGLWELRWRCGVARPGLCVPVCALGCWWACLSEPYPTSAVWTLAWIAKIYCWWPRTFGNWVTSHSGTVHFTTGCAKRCSGCQE